MKIFRFLFMCMLVFAFVACESDPYDVEDDIVGRSWTGDVGFVADNHEPVISTFTFFSDGFGEECQHYYRDGAYYDTFRFRWYWEDAYTNNLVLDYGRGGVYYMDDVSVSGRKMYGVFTDGHGSGFHFELYMDN